jgi:hypothetical protein
MQGLLEGYINEGVMVWVVMGAVGVDWEIILGRNKKVALVIFWC